MYGPQKHTMSVSAWKCILAWTANHSYTSAPCYGVERSHKTHICMQRGTIFELFWCYFVAHFYCIRCAQTRLVRHEQRLLSSYQAWHFEATIQGLTSAKLRPFHESKHGPYCLAAKSYTQATKNNPKIVISTIDVAKLLG